MKVVAAQAGVKRLPPPMPGAQHKTHTIPSIQTLPYTKPKQI